MTRSTSTTLFFGIIAATTLSLVTHANAAAVTLYYVDRPRETVTPTDNISIEFGATESYLVIGPAQETGVTRYAVEQVVSRFDLHGNADNPPHCYFGAIDKDLEHLPGLYTTAGPEGQPYWLQGVKQDCKLDLEKKQGVCVDEYELPVATAITTQDSSTVFSTYTTNVGVTTYTGPLLPLATVTTGAASGVAASMMTVVSGVVAMTAFLAVKL
ncbi:hypothetical protein BJ165DRAFT_1533082 [Panaeolus papilionaceus]|nr:hypothetical protein BJ165DRAFT_1533082 [Panaeolus papilionaceus]